jgi:hypothetical protein
MPFSIFRFFSRLFMQTESIPRPNNLHQLFPPAQSINGVSVWASSVTEFYAGEPCRITSVSYWKCDKGKEHEFLIVHASHLRTGAPVILATDRCVKSNDEASPRRKVDSLTLASSHTTPAHDRVILSYDGTQDCVVNEFKHGKPKPLTTHLYSLDRDGPTILQLAVILDVVSKHAPHYDLWEKQCYWFAGTVWYAICNLFPPLELKKLDRASSYLGLPVPQSHATETIVAEYQTRLAALDAEEAKRVAERERREREVS